MNVKQTRRSDMLKRVHRFGIEYSDTFPLRSTGRQLFDAVRETLAQLPHQDVTHMTGRNQARAGTADKNAARESLRAALAAVNRTARAVAIERPGFSRRFRLPSREGDRALLAAARATAAAARTLKHRFVAYGLRASFVDDLHGAIARFEQAVARRAAGRRVHIGARASLDAALMRAFSMVRRLDAIVVNVLGEDTVAMKQWRQARRVARRRASKARRSRHATAKLTVIKPDHAQEAGTSG